MIRTFIYGVPNGFDFYEKDAGLNEYFKGFYISSRRGRRLMINRRENGETIYSYLRYGLREIERQPLHSFFGMSLVIDNYQYCPNFKVLLEWFDFLFDKLVNEHNLIKIGDDGIFHYVCRRFADNVADVEWLKSNLPNILTQSEQTQTVNYDSTFVRGKAGQVVSFEEAVGENVLADAFRKFCWISVSSDIVEKQALRIGESLNIELDFEDLNSKLNEYNQRLLPIAVDITRSSPVEIERLQSEVLEINDSLVKYLPTISDREEQAKFRVLHDNYGSLLSSINALFAKMAKPVMADLEKPETQYCFTCKQNKPLSAFRSPESTRCIECEQQQKNALGLGDTIKGKDGDLLENQIPLHNFVNLLKSKITIVSTAAGFVIALVLVLFFLIPPKETPSDTEPLPSNAVVESNNKVDKTLLQKHISSGKWDEVYKDLSGKVDADTYKPKIKGDIENALWNVIDSIEAAENAKNALVEFYINNKPLLDFVDFSEKDQQKWENVASDYEALWNILKKSKITDEERTRGEIIIAKHNTLFKPQWKELLASKPKETKPEPVSSSIGAGGRITYTLTFIDKAGNRQSKKIVQICGYDVKKGTTATITCFGGTLKQNGKENYTTSEIKDKVVIHCSDKIAVTLTPKSNFESAN